MEDLDLAPLGRWREPETALPVEARSGPIVVTVDHRVAEANAPAFLDAMAVQRRICRRDGARRWRLLQDLEDPELWIERFHMPTWLDYVRDTRRRTKEDAENLERVRRMIERQPGATAAALARHGPHPRELAEPLIGLIRAS